MTLTYPVELMTSLITVSAALIALAGILIAFMVIRTEPSGGPAGYKRIRMVLFSSLGLGVLAMILSLSWLDEPSNVLIILASVCTGLQLGCIITSLVMLTR